MTGNVAAAVVDAVIVDRPFPAPSGNRPPRSSGPRSRSSTVVSNMVSRVTAAPPAASRRRKPSEPAVVQCRKHINQFRYTSQSLLLPFNFSSSCNFKMCLFSVSFIFKV